MKRKVYLYLDIGSYSIKYKISVLDQFFCELSRVSFLRDSFLAVDMFGDDFLLEKKGGTDFEGAGRLFLGDTVVCSVRDLMIFFELFFEKVQKKMSLSGFSGIGSVYLSFSVDGSGYGELFREVVLMTGAVEDVCVVDRSKIMAVAIKKSVDGCKVFVDLGFSGVRFYIYNDRNAQFLGSFDNGIYNLFIKVRDIVFHKYSDNILWDDFIWIYNNFAFDIFEKKVKGVYLWKKHVNKYQKEVYIGLKEQMMKIKQQVEKFLKVGNIKENDCTYIFIGGGMFNKSIEKLFKKKYKIKIYSISNPIFFIVDNIEKFYK